MKKVFLFLSLLILPTIAKAESSIIDAISQIPSLNQGFAISLQDSNINYMSTIDIVKKYGFNLEVGYAGAAKETGDKLVAVLSVELLNLKDKTTLPILNLIEFRPGLWIGAGRITGSNEFDWGVSATVVSLKF